jgi:hypothetical protein
MGPSFALATHRDKRIFWGRGGREHEEYNFLGPNVSQCVQLVVGLVAFRELISITIKFSCLHFQASCGGNNNNNNSNILV